MFTEYGDYVLNPSFEEQMKVARYKDAAVLIGLRDICGEANVVLTQRTAPPATRASSPSAFKRPSNRCTGLAVRNPAFFNKTVNSRAFHASCG
jgi:hypothetical protein